MTRNSSTIAYASYNLSTSIASGANTSTLTYGAWRNRSKQVAVTAGVTETSIYVAGLLERVTKGGVTDFRHLINGTPGIVAIHTRRSSGTSDTYYLHRDHLGSAELITNAAGAQVVKLSFSAYGERRDTDWDGPASSADLTTLGNTTRHGYTDHEHLDSVGLIHMRGRVYDPRIGRFLSRDPYIDGVASSQGVNGYAYVHNNPLSRWDPTGYNHEPPLDVPGSRPRFSWSAADWHHFVARFPYRNEGGGRGAGGDGGDGDGAKEEPAQQEPQEQIPDDCTAVPSAPPGVDVRNNIEIARDHSALNPGSLFAFYQLVRNGGDWDYKQVGKVPNVPSPYEAFGNFNYGATGTAMGIPDQLLLRAAGAASMLAGTSPQDPGNPLWRAPYGDSPVDQAWIKQGIQYSRCMDGAGQ